MFVLKYKYGDYHKTYCNRDGIKMCRSFENHLGSEGVDDVAVDLITSESTNYTVEGEGEEALSEWVAHRTAWHSAATACMNFSTTADSYNEKQESGKHDSVSSPSHSEKNELFYKTPIQHSFLLLTFHFAIHARLVLHIATASSLRSG